MWRAVIFASALLSVAVFGCAHVGPPMSREQRVQALRDQAAKVSSVKGRVWVSAKSPEGSISFPADVAIDRTSVKEQKLRLAAIGPFGVTYSLLVLSGGRLTWIDYDRKTVTRVERTWHGLPVGALPELFLGICPRLEGGGKFTLKFTESESEAVLKEISGELRGRRGEVETYTVGLSEHAGPEEFGLPREIELHGVRDGKEVRVRLSWRGERIWNETVAPVAFVVPPTEF